MSSEFGKLLKYYREQNNVSQAEVLNKLKVQGYSYDKSAISKWETGLHVPRAEVVEILEDVLTPQSVGLLLKAAGYLHEAESRFQSLMVAGKRQTPKDEEYSRILRKIISNLRKYLHSPSFLSTAHTPGNAIYGDGSAPALLADLEPIDKDAALKLLKLIQGESPELADIDDWADLPDERISNDFIERLVSMERQGGF